MAFSPPPAVVEGPGGWRVVEAFSPVRPPMPPVPWRRRMPWWHAWRRSLGRPPCCCDHPSATRRSRHGAVSWSFSPHGCYRRWPTSGSSARTSGRDDSSSSSRGDSTDRCGRGPLLSRYGCPCSRARPSATGTGSCCAWPKRPSGTSMRMRRTCCRSLGSSSVGGAHDRRRPPPRSVDPQGRPRRSLPRRLLGRAGVRMRPRDVAEERLGGGRRGCVVTRRRRKRRRRRRTTRRSRTSARASRTRTRAQQVARLECAAQERRRHRGPCASDHERIRRGLGHRRPTGVGKERRDQYLGDEAGARRVHSREHDRKLFNGVPHPPAPLKKRSPLRERRAMVRSRRRHRDGRGVGARAASTASHEHPCALQHRPCARGA